MNKGKTEVYCWTATYRVDQLLWDRQVNTVRPPILSYLGHTIAHPQRAHKGRSDYLDLIASDLAQYAHIPIDGWERRPVVNSILMPRWLNRAALIPSDRWYKEIDDLCSVFVRQPKGMVPGRNAKQLTAPVACGGMGLHQLYWAHRQRFITTMQQTIRHQHRAFCFSLNNQTERIQTPFLAYVTLLNSIGAISGISLQQPRRRPARPNLIDSEDTEDGHMIRNQMSVVD